MATLHISLDLDAVADAVRTAGPGGSVSLAITVNPNTGTSPAPATAVTPRGPLAPLLQARLLNDGDRLRFEQPRAGRTAYATVHATGRLSVDGKVGTFTSPSKAASAVTGSQINGWTLWHKEGDGRTLDQLREELDASEED
jgi:hypothetical protein